MRGGAAICFKKRSQSEWKKPSIDVFAGWFLESEQQKSSEKEEENEIDRQTDRQTAEGTEGKATPDLQHPILGHVRPPITASTCHESH